MSNYLPNFNNIYANLSQSAYPDNPNDFPKYSKSDTFQQIDYSQSHTHTHVDGKGKTHTHTTQGGQGLPNNGVVYLQPDSTGVMSNGITGFNAYMVTDTPTINQNTDQAYMAIRGSDGAPDISEPKNLNDWANNLYFGIAQKDTPQSKNATAAMQHQLKTLRQAGSSAKLDITGHSLGSINSVLGAARLSLKELDQIGQIVLFNGPDPTAALHNMRLSKQVIQKLDSKIVYYVNPFDPVSMFGRDNPNQIGTVHIVVPLQFKGGVYAHLFGGFQTAPGGQILTASADYHPYLIAAGRNLAQLNAEAIAKIKALGISDSDIDTFLQADLTKKWDVIEAKYKDSKAKVQAIKKDYEKRYKDIIKQARKDSIEWISKNISTFQKRIKNPGPGDSPIVLRSQLLYMASQLATLEVEDQLKAVKKSLSNAKDDLEKRLRETRQSIEDAAQYLSPMQVMSFLGQCDISHYWNDEVEKTTKTSGQDFKTMIENFASTLNESAQRLEEVDSSGVQLFEQFYENHH